MTLPTAERIQHDSVIFSLAVSLDEQLLACGGTDQVPITVWDLTTGSLVTRLSGLSQQAHALAFSADGALLAAANVWGGLCVWSVADGRLQATHPNSSGRKKRSLVYPRNRRDASLPLMLSDSIAGTTSRALSPNGRFLARLNSTIQIKPYRKAALLAELNPQSWAFTQSGLSQIAWAADSETVAVAGPGWLGCWQPLAAPALFFATPLPTPHEVAVLAMLGQSRQVLYAIGTAVQRWTAQTPLAPALTPWQRFINEVPLVADGRLLTQEWTWDVTQWGYEGVHTYEGQLLWYSHSHNPHAGGGATAQPYADFLADGPPVAVPEPILREICQVVRQLVKAG